MSLKLGEMLVKQGVIRPDQMAQALEENKKNGTRFSQALVNLGFVKDKQILQGMEKGFGMPGSDVSAFEIDPQVIELVTREFCEKNLLIPLQRAGQTLVVAFSDPSNVVVREDMRFLTRLKIQPVVATELAILSAIERYYGGNLSKQAFAQIEGDEEVGIEAPTSTAEIIDQQGTGVDAAPVVKFVNAVLAEAIRKKVADIHFEPYEKRYRVRFRIDGNLVETASPPPGTGLAIAARIKIMSKLDIAEKRLPQDGRLKVKTSKGKEMDFRVNTLPTLWGEKIVLRLLDKSNLQLDMTKLGFEEEELRLFKSNIHLPQGMVLITGPTGSGKTTTIYSALAELNTTDVNISTAEDPAEFNLEGINQVQMNSEIGLTFASTLRAFLRQDPDIIMVGEIRDLETAEISFKAASTGHLVVSTLHTNDAPSTVTRLLEMGVAGYIITSCINLIVAQRLVGKICESCKTPIDVPEQTIINLGVAKEDVKDYQVFKGQGCSNCNNTGIKGRIAIYELMTMSNKVKELILSGGTSEQLRVLARQEGMKTLRRSALSKLKKGITTIEEVLNSSIRDT
ncbi:MAG: type IV-A pilus assembly ATPase PilB [Bdellovibrionales bacterium]